MTDPTLAPPLTPEAAGESDTAGRLVRGGTLRLAGYLGTIGLSIISALLLTRHLGVSRFGQFTTVTSLVAVVATVTDSGMANIGTREYATQQEPARTELLADLLGLRVALTLIGVVLVTLAAAALGYGRPLLLGAVGASLATVSLVCQHTLTIPLTVDLRLGSVSALDFARQAVTVAGIVVLVLLGAGLFPLLAVTLVANTLIIVPSAMLVRGRISLRPSVHLARWRALIGSTVAFSLATAVGVIYLYTAQIVCSIVTTQHQTGLFSVSFRVFIVAATIPGLLAGSALPVLSRAAHDDRDRLGYVMQRMFEASLVGGVGLAVVLAAGAGFIVMVIGGPEYAASAPVLTIQAYALIASFMTAGWGFGLLSLRRHRSLLIANASALAVSLVATAVLASQDGARGAAIATLCGEGVLALACLIALICAGSELRPRAGVVWKVALAGGLASLAALGFSMPSLMRALVAVAVYSAVVLLTRALPPEFRALLPRRSTPR